MTEYDSGPAAFAGSFFYANINCQNIPTKSVPYRSCACLGFCFLTKEGVAKMTRKNPLLSEMHKTFVPKLGVV